MPLRFFRLVKAAMIISNWVQSDIQIGPIFPTMVTFARVSEAVCPVKDRRKAVCCNIYWSCQILCCSNCVNSMCVNFLTAGVKSTMFHATRLRLDGGLHTNTDRSVICMANEPRYKSTCSFR